MTPQNAPTSGIYDQLAIGGEVTLIGNGNHSKDIQTIAWRCKRRCIVYANDNDVPPDIEYATIAINDSEIRRHVAEKLDVLGDVALVDPSAVVGPNVLLNFGTVVAPNAVLLTEVELGYHCHINYGATMTRCKMQSFSTISPGATICGNVEIGECTMIGAGAVVCERSTVGNNVRVGAGAIIPPHSKVPDGVTVRGVWKNRYA